MDTLHEKLMAAAGELVDSGIIGAGGGAISVRLPEGAGFLITPPGFNRMRIAPDSVWQITPGGDILGKRRKPPLDTNIHLRIYAARPDVESIVISHGPMTIVTGICQVPILPITMDSIPFADIPRVQYDPSGLVDMGLLVADAIGNAPALLLLNHGAVAVGSTIEQAVERAEALEEIAYVMVISHLLQRIPTTLPAEAVEIIKQAGL
ncbi:MAG: class II aldolase/adducin family protein [Chloroflexi bacterium]|nr:class II aldolase/adducin family protein [Chloroflexota bacterium]